MDNAAAAAAAAAVSTLVSEISAMMANARKKECKEIARAALKQAQYQYDNRLSTVVNYENDLRLIKANLEICQST